MACLSDCLGFNMCGGVKDGFGPTNLVDGAHFEESFCAVVRKGEVVGVDGNG